MRSSRGSIPLGFNDVLQVCAQQGYGVSQMNLFQSGEFTLASGSKSYFKIEMDALKAEDWKTLAKMAVEHLLPPFAEVHGVPTGGQRFAEALEPYAKSNGPGRHRLICDDVLTLRWINGEVS